MLGLIELAAPAMLGGLALLSLPLLAHLLNRQARRRIIFPSIKFLVASTAAQARVSRLRRWLLLLLRMIAVAAVVLAFAQPVWQATSSAGGDRGAAVVLVLDASLSTRQSADGLRLFDALKSSAARTLDGLRPGVDVANVVVVGASSRSVFSRLSPNLAALREELAKLEPTYDRAEFSSALATAGELLRGHEGERRVVFLTDMQQSNWADLVDQLPRMNFFPSGVAVAIVEPAAESAANVGLSEPKSLPAEPLADQPLRLGTLATNHAGEPREARIQAFRDATPLSPLVQRLNPRQSADVVFDDVVKKSDDSARPDDGSRAAGGPAPAGTHLVRFVADADALDADNEAFFVLRVGRRRRVLIVSDESPRDSGSGTFFLARALAPRGDATDRFDVQHAEARGLTAGDLDGAHAVMLAYTAQLSAQSASLLLDYVRLGGGLVVFLGEGDVEQRLLALDSAGGAADQALPWRPGAARRLSRREETYRITGGRFESRFLKAFDAQSQLVLARIRFSNVSGVGPVHSQAQVLLTFQDQTPALGLRPVGQGQLAVANFSPAQGASDLGKYGAFVALAQILAQEIRPAVAASRAAVVGEPYRHHEFVPVSEGAVPVVTGPLGEAVAAELISEGGRMSFQIPAPARPGFYRLNAGARTLAVAAINVDPRESDLQRMPRETLLHAWKQSGVGIEIQSAETLEPALSFRGHPLWHTMFIVALAAIAVELALLGWWRR